MKAKATMKVKPTAKARVDQLSMTARAIAMMRHGFGGHPFGRNPAIARERRESRIGAFPERAKGNRT